MKMRDKKGQLFKNKSWSVSLSHLLIEGEGYLDILQDNSLSVRYRIKELRLHTLTLCIVK